MYTILDKARNYFQINELTTFLKNSAENNLEATVELMSHIEKGLKLWLSKRYRQCFILYDKLLEINDTLADKRVIQFKKLIKALN